MDDLLPLGANGPVATLVENTGKIVGQRKLADAAQTARIGGGGPGPLVEGRVDHRIGQNAARAGSPVIDMSAANAVPTREPSEGGEMVPKGRSTAFLTEFILPP